MNINRFKPIALALALSMALIGCGNQTATAPTKEETKETEQVETVETTKVEEPVEEVAETEETTEAEVTTEEETEIEAKEEDNKVETTSLTDGTYQAKANGYDREVNLEVTITDGKISDIALLENHDSEAVIERAFPIMKERIIEANSPDVDSVSSATTSSFAIKAATLEAMKEAGLAEGAIEIDRSTGYEEDRELTEGEDLTTDILVIGGGPAGLSAAIQAKEDGAENVILIEKLDILSGNGKFDLNFFDLANSEAMKANDNIVTKEEYRQRFADKTWDSEERIDAMTEGAFVLDQWLRKQGVELDYNYGGEGSMNHLHTETEYAGHHIQTMLEKSAYEHGVTILTGTKATDLIMEDGVAKGAVVEDKNTYYNITADATVLATGGFVNNKELLAEYLPGYEELPNTNPMGSTGDFVEIAKKYDIKLDHMDDGYIFNKILDPRRDLTGYLQDNFVFVNEKGERFIDENGHGLEYAQTMLANKPVYFIFDDKDAQIQRQVYKGYMNTAESIDALAEVIGCDVETLKESFDTFNKAVAGEIEEPFREKAASLPIDYSGELYYQKVVPALHMTKGGIVADEKGQVYDINDQVIPGLFAGGEVTDTSGAYASSVIFGRISGTSAVAYINK